MKRYRKCTLLALLMVLVLTCTAQAAGGLDNFSESRSMDGSTFTDVKVSSWFYSGVKSAYDMKIMEGMGGGRFAPSETVPWSQAVTIAARVRAAYLGEEIPAAEGAWYQPYVAYAAACGILPANHPEGTAWNTTAIDRQSIAYLFQAVVDKDDCPSISDLTIPDLEAVAADKQEAVRSLYTAGIFTGKNGGNFDPTGLTTRAELATILNRLLRPAYRVAHDSRLFTLQTQLTASGDFVDTLGELKGNSIKPLGKYYRVDSIYGFNGKIYVEAAYGKELHAYDLTTGKTEKLLEGTERCVFNGGTVYYLLWDNGEYSDQVWMASLADPTRAVKYGTVPESALTHYVNLAHDGRDLYYIASSSYVLYRIVPGQVAEKVLANRFGTVENPIIWDDCFLAGNPGLAVGGNYVGEYPVTTGIGTANVFRTNVDHWLGYSALMVRTAFPQSGAAYTNNAPLAEGDSLAVRKAYYSGDSLVLDVDYYNPDTAKIRAIRNMDVTVTAAGVTLAKDVRVVDNEDVKPGKTGQLTIVIQGDDLLATGADLSDLKWRIGVSYNLYNPY